jgi:hypothetical protein
MISTFLRKVRKAFFNVPNLFHGYNIYVNRHKLELIEKTFVDYFPQAKSFADLGGVWKVNAAYTLHTLKKFQVEKGFLVDTDFPQAVKTKLLRLENLTLIEKDFASQTTVDAIGRVDVIYFFDVLLHQANPDWDEIIERYSKNCSCFVIYNQQYIRGEKTIRLLDLPFEKYIELASDHSKEFSRFVYEHKNEIHPKFNKPWKDIHNITQWGITDTGLREVMTRLGYKEVFYKNYGIFIDLPAFENHAFVFVKK